MKACCLVLHEDLSNEYNGCTYLAGKVDLIFLKCQGRHGFNLMCFAFIDEPD